MNNRGARTAFLIGMLQGAINTLDAIYDAANVYGIYIAHNEIEDAIVNVLGARRLLQQALIEQGDGGSDGR